MIYRSNLTAPDLTPYFRLRNPPMLTPIGGHDMPSDPDFLPDCGFLTHDEAAILYGIAKAWPRRWVDIGARLGWSAAHIAAAGGTVVCVDPELHFANFTRRFERSLDHCWTRITLVEAATSSDSLERPAYDLDAAMIDGNHNAPEPTLDAMRAINAGAKVLVWHDFWGDPVADAVDAVIDLGWKCRTYDTPNGMAVCWLDGCGFVPPDHTPDPVVDWREIRSRMPRFNFGRTV